MRKGTVARRSREERESGKAGGQALGVRERRNQTEFLCILCFRNWGLQIRGGCQRSPRDR